MGQDIHVYLARKKSEYDRKRNERDWEPYYPVELYTKYDDEGTTYDYADPYCGRNYELFSWLMEGDGRAYVDESDHPMEITTEYYDLVPKKIQTEWEDWETCGAYGYNVVMLSDIIDHYNMMDTDKRDVCGMLGSYPETNMLKVYVGNFIDDIKRYCSLEGAYFLSPKDILVAYWFDS